MTEIPPEAVPAEWLQAAWDADLAWLRSPDRERGGSWGAVPKAQLRRVLAAAAPLIAAAERDRIRHAVTSLREQAQHLAELTGDVDPLSVGFHAQDEVLAAVLDLLRDEP